MSPHSGQKYALTQASKWLFHGSRVTTPSLSLCSVLRSGSHLGDREPSLLAKRGEIEVDAFAPHQSLSKRSYVHERNRKRQARRRYSKPVSSARPAQGTPGDQHVVAESKAFVLWG